MINFRRWASIQAETDFFEPVERHSHRFDGTPPKNAKRSQTI